MIEVTRMFPARLVIMYNSTHYFIAEDGTPRYDPHWLAQIDVMFKNGDGGDPVMFGTQCKAESLEDISPDELELLAEVLALEIAKRGLRLEDSIVPRIPTDSHLKSRIYFIPEVKQ